jgi:hypothetical protein
MNIPDKIDFSWQELAISNLDTLVPVRYQLHYAVQFIAAAGKYLIEPRPDDSHTSLIWHQPSSSFMGQPILNKHNYYISLKPANLELSICNDKKLVLKSTRLHQNSRTSILAWMRSSLSELGIDSKQLRLEMHYEIPDHSLAHGEDFELINTEYFEFFSGIYSNADHIFSAIKKLIPEASEMRCWPHHFDIAALISLDPDRDAEQGRSIGIGMSPGDAEFAHPYFYITPWPYPDKSVKFPDVTGPGSWYTKSWTGRLLDLSELLKAVNQKETLERFMIEGIGACKELLVQ